jgi:F0F1-type ATP synthase membrane subunit b/b'
VSLELLAQWSQIAGAVVFVVVILLVWRRWIAPAVQSYQEAKNAELAEAEARRERMRADAAAARADAEHVGVETRTIRERAAADAEHERKRILAEAQDEAERLVRNAKGEIERARMAARDRLRIEFIEKALIQARKQAAGVVDDAVNAALIEETVATLVHGAADA